MKALMLHSENSGVGYYRVWQQTKYLRKLGWDIYRQPDSLPAMNPTDWETISEGADLIVMQRADSPDALALALAMRELRNCPLVFEVDDNIYDVAKNSTAYKYWYPGSPLIEVTELFMQNADAMTVSTPELAEVYKHLNPNIHVLRNCQDPEIWPEPVHKESDEIVIGWAGSSTHYDDLHIIRPVIKKILHKYKNVKFVIMGCKPDFLENIDRVEFRMDFAHVSKWPQKLSSLDFDIGVAPVVDRPFNRGKSNIKWQEYSMLSIPTVASKVGEYKTIENYVTGFLADSEGSWLFYLEQLIKDAAMRQAIGQRARAKVITEFNIERNISDWDKLYKSIISKHNAKEPLTSE